MPEVDGQFWNNAAQSAFAGVVAALVAAGLLELARSVRRWMAWRRDVTHIRDLLVEGRTRVLEAKATFNKDMRVEFPEDMLRAAQYNNMIKKLGLGLEKWTPNLSHAQRKDLLDALDWYHTRGLQVKKNKISNKIEFVDIPDGKWPTVSMELDHATEIFGRLQSVRWLNLPRMHWTVPGHPRLFRFYIAPAFLEYFLTRFFKSYILKVQFTLRIIEFPARCC